MSDIAVSVEHLSKTYGGDQPVAALADVDAWFRRGTATAVMGPSGSGKSNLMHCAAVSTGPPRRVGSAPPICRR